LEKRIYTTVKGMTLYTMYCFDDTADHLECDDAEVGPHYWLSFCGGEERCAETWRPLPAPVGAKPIENVWSLITINPRRPWLAMDKTAGGLRVWAYRGRPVFTYEQDSAPGDFYGSGINDQGMRARYLLAYETDYKL
jgi:predicted lipoprotein with Yx(FWY)xxD motif